MKSILKLLIKIGGLATGVVMISCCAAVMLPTVKAYAAGYEEKTDFSVMELSEWRFAEGINKTSGNFTLLKEDGTADTGEATEKVKRLIKDDTDNIIGAKYHFLMEDGFIWNSIAYDVHVEMIQYRTGGAYTLTGGIDDWGSYRCLLDSSVRMFQFSGKNRQDYRLEYKIWLQTGDNIVQTSGANGVPFLFGPVYHSQLEVDSIYSSEKVYTNIVTDKATLSTYAEYYSSSGLNGFKMRDNTKNQPYYYFAGVGHDNNTVKGKYGLTSGNGELEFRMGYRAYSLEYVAASGANINASTIPEKEIIAVPDSSNPGTPADKANQIQPSGTHKITTYKLKEIFYGDDTNKITVPTDQNFITLKNGTTIALGSEIKPSQIPLILMDKNIIIEVNTIDDALAVKLDYHLQNDKVPLLPAHTSGTTNLSENYESGTTTSNGSYKPGAIVTGTDSREYKLVGWYTDDTYATEYTFGATITANDDIYAKWELVNDPTTTPTPTPTPKPSDSTPAPAGGPIKVEFVTPFGITPDTQIKNVGDKADDPGIPKDPSTLKPGTVIGGYRFEGWYLDQGYTLPYSFDTKLQHSIVLYAKWVRVSPKTGDGAAPNMLYVLTIIAFACAGLIKIKAKTNK